MGNETPSRREEQSPTHRTRSKLFERRLNGECLVDYRYDDNGPNKVSDPKDWSLSDVGRHIASEQTNK